MVLRLNLCLAGLTVALFSSTALALDYSDLPEYCIVRASLVERPTVHAQNRKKAALYEVGDVLFGDPATNRLVIFYYPAALAEPLPDKALLLLAPGDIRGVFTIVGAEIGSGIWPDSPHNRAALWAQPIETYFESPPEARISEFDAFRVAYSELDESQLFNIPTLVSSERKPFSWKFRLKTHQTAHGEPGFRSVTLEVSDLMMVIDFLPHIQF